MDYAWALIEQVLRSLCSMTAKATWIGDGTTSMGIIMSPKSRSSGFVQIYFIIPLNIKLCSGQTMFRTIQKSYNIIIFEGISRKHVLIHVSTGRVSQWRIASGIVNFNWFEELTGKLNS
jgi:hypothetical protein